MPDQDGKKRTADAMALNLDFVNLTDEQEVAEQGAPTKRIRLDAQSNPDLAMLQQPIPTQHQQQQQYPWMHHDYSQQPTAIRMLNQELTDFADYLMPTQEEHHIRSYVFRLVEQVIVGLFDSAQVHMFGSFKTRLYLPESDLDIVAILSGHKQQKILTRIAKALNSSRVGTNIETILFANVPLVKFQESTTGIQVDISLNQRDGFKTTALIQEYMEEMPVLQPMTMLVKQFLKSKPAKFNEVHAGGLGSFAITMMVMSFLQMHPMIQAKRIDPMENLGVLMIEFFELYGLCFNYNKVGISVVEGGSYVAKGGSASLESEPLLTCVNPFDNRNVAKGTRNISIIRASFADAYYQLTGAVKDRQQELDLLSHPQGQSSPSTATPTMTQSRSMIDRVFLFPAHLQQHRDVIHDLFHQRHFQTMFGDPPGPSHLGQVLDPELAEDIKEESELSSVGDGDFLLKQEEVEEEDPLILSFRRHFRKGSRAFRSFTIFDMAATFKKKLVANATEVDRSTTPLLDDATLESIQTDVRDIYVTLRAVKDRGTKLTPEMRRKVTGWKNRLKQLRMRMRTDKLVLVATVVREAARLAEIEEREWPRQTVSSITNTQQQQPTSRQQQQESASQQWWEGSLQSQSARIQELSLKVAALFSNLDPENQRSVGYFQHYYQELMVRQAQFGVAQVEAKEGKQLKTIERKQLMEWSNSAVADSLRSLDPRKMASFENALSGKQGTSSLGLEATGARAKTEVPDISEAADFYEVDESDEDDFEAQDSDEEPDEYFDTMMREAQEEYGSSSDEATSSTADPIRGAHQDPHNINTGSDSIQFSHLYTPKIENAGNSSRYEQLEKMRRQE
ncbi:hypothetical protein BGX29_000726 [Mortierella sp. GBA35]|nr:hypothetical protein BGX29_000726 [Mortierella sp. GBA35]